MKELYKALANFQQVIEPIYKGTSGYGYKYADWGEILKVVNPIMKMNGLGFTQLLDGNNLKTIVFHAESGESIESSVEIPQNVELAKMNTFQVMGSAITYYKRYSLSAILGLVTDEDADASGEQVKPKATHEVRDRVAEAKTGSEPIAEAEPQESVLARAKRTIFAGLNELGYDAPVQQKAFITRVLKKSTIDNLNEADEVMTQIENEQESK